MKFSVCAILAALALSAASSPVNTSMGVMIPLSKRGGAVNADGVANPEWYRRHRANVIAKYQRGFEHYERNTGKVHPLANKKASKRGTGSNALTDDDNSMWYGTIKVGTPPVQYTVDYDTGSSDLFLPGSKCGATCDGHTRYNPTKSSTSSDLHKTYTLEYGDGSSVSGEQYTDTVTISGLSAIKQTLGASTTYSTGFSSSGFPADGLMGMGYKSLSVYDANPFIQSLKAQGKISAAVFAFKLANSGSSLFLGGTDSSLHTGKFTYVSVTEQGYWQVDLDDIAVDGTSLVGSASSIIDTGTTLIVGDPDSVKQVIAGIDGAQSAPDEYGEGSYMAPCSSISTLSLTFAGMSWDVSPSTFNMGTIEDDTENCLLGIAGDSSINFWIVGDVFLRNVYAAFDLDKNRVGFAKLA